MAWPGWYDRQGRSISVEEAERLRGEHGYKIIGRAEVGPYVVSTVWVGLDMRIHLDDQKLAPLIFETMVFGRDEWNDPNREGLADIDCQRYCTEDEALTGHRQMVELIMATTDLNWEADEEGPQ